MDFCTQNILAVRLWSEIGRFGRVFFAEDGEGRKYAIPETEYMRAQNAQTIQGKSIVSLYHTPVYHEPVGV